MRPRGAKTGPIQGQERPRSSKRGKNPFFCRFLADVVLGQNAVTGRNLVTGHKSRWGVFPKEKTKKSGDVFPRKKMKKSGYVFPKEKMKKSAYDFLRKK